MIWNSKTAINDLLALPSDTIKVVAFSGGKDSTALLGLMLAADRLGLKNWRVINSDTLMEIPFLEEHIKACGFILKEKGIQFERVTAPMQRRFFYSLIGKGIPSPSRNFRWCTQALKIDPLEKALKNIPSYLLLNGERLGESIKRDIKLAIKTCDGTNECGTVEIKKKIKNAEIVRPLLNATACNIWDTIAENDIEKKLLPGSFNRLNNVYSINDEDNSKSLRTGCIGCPLVNKDRSLQKLISVYEDYSPLSQLRTLYDSTRSESNRIMRPDMKSKGAVKLEVRKKIWAEILEIESKVCATFPEFTLIQQDEKDAIEKALSEGQYPKGYTRQHIQEQESLT
jgi:DNA sulfur modification protein DndC